MQDLIFWIFIFATFLQLFFWGGIFSRLARYRIKKNPPSPTSDLPGVSVIICARNEAENLKENLPYILNQDYPLFELIVVNDDSNDKSWEILLDIQTKNPILRPVNVHKKLLPGKKAALTKGIEAAHYETVLLTDADCRPASSDWIFQMQSTLKGPIQIGLGYGPYFSKKGFLNFFIRFETVYTAIQYHSFTLIRWPYMGVGRNLIYRKSLFAKTDGFRQHSHLASGDDDLFINAVSTGDNTVIMLDPATFVYSHTKSSWRDYYYQKSRHLSTGSHYRLRHQVALGALSASHLIHYAGAGILLLLGCCPLAVFVSYLVRILVVVAVYTGTLSKLKAVDLLPWIPILDLFYLLYYFAFAPALLTTGNQRKWK
ncbi:MAG: glycosyl transferase family 2 [Saprospiraceae bacterium]|nr:MAG: glycosyl transferase family 2 [Saprospiraceae bacterium]